MISYIRSVYMIRDFIEFYINVPVPSALFFPYPKTCSLPPPIANSLLLYTSFVYLLYQDIHDIFHLRDHLRVSTRPNDPLDEGLYLYAANYILDNIEWNAFDDGNIERSKVLMGAERITYTIARYVLDPIDEGINSTLERRVYKSEIYGMFRLSHYRSRHTGGELEEDTDKNSHDSSNSSGDDGAEDEGNESGNGEGDGAAGGDGAAAGGGFSFYFGDPPDTPDVAPVAAATAIMEKELASLWEKMRRLDIGKEDPSKLMKAKIPDSAGSNVSSCVLQTCVKYCSQAEKEAVFIELQPHFLNLASNTYAVFLLKKMLDGASKQQLTACISSLRGHVGSLLRHMVGSVVVEHAYHLGTAAQKQELLGELYSTELQLFKGLTSTTEKRVVDIIPKLGLQKGAVIRHMTAIVQPILEKGIVDHSIIHKLLIEYLTIADKTSAEFVIQQLTGPLLLRMVHTRDGSRLAMLCIKHGSAKERKKIIKAMKSHVGKMALDQFGSMVLACIFSIVDDTKLVTKIIVRELEATLKDLVMEKNGRRPLLQLLQPNSSRYFSQDDLASLDLSVPSLCLMEKSETSSQTKDSDSKESGEEAKDEQEDTVIEHTDLEENVTVAGGKKDPLLRRQELLVNSGLAERLIDVCVENAEEFLKSNLGKELMYEVAMGGADGILCPSLSEKLCELYKAIASVAAKPKPQEPEKNSEHILENFHSSRTIRRLILDCPAFASTLFKKALSGNCRSWAQGHCSKIISAFLETRDLQVREMAKEEVQVLVDEGALKIPDTKKPE